MDGTGYVCVRRDAVDLSVHKLSSNDYCRNEGDKQVSRRLCLSFHKWCQSSVIR